MRVYAQPFMFQDPAAHGKRQSLTQRSEMWPHTLEVWPASDPSASAVGGYAVQVDVDSMAKGWEVVEAVTARVGPPPSPPQSPSF